MMMFIFRLNKKRNSAIKDKQLEAMIFVLINFSGIDPPPTGVGEGDDESLKALKFSFFMKETKKTTK